MACGVNCLLYNRLLSNCVINKRTKSRLRGRICIFLRLYKENWKVVLSASFLFYCSYAIWKWPIGACYSLSWVHQYKNKHSDLFELGAKSFEWCLYDNETYTPLLCCSRFKQGERVFLLPVSRCGISRRQAHVREWQDGKPSSWNIM